MAKLNVTPAEVERKYRASLANQDRAPFIDQAARLLANQPTDSKLKAWANKYPDRWAQAVATFARLSGYTEKTENISTSLHIAIAAMSDGDLLAQLESINSQLSDVKAPAVINITPRTDNPSKE